MADIIVTFNHTWNTAYDSYAKLSYAVAYEDNPDTLQSTAAVTVDFFIKPDPYTYSQGATESLYLGIRKGSSSAALTKVNISPTLTNGAVTSNTFNLVGTTTFEVTYSSTDTYTVYLAAGYNNSKSSRFAPLYIPSGDGEAYKDYRYTAGGSNAVTLEKRISYTACGAPKSVSATPGVFEGGITLSWSGAVAGYHNEISGYRIQERTCYDNSNWGSWWDLSSVSTTSSSGSYSYTPPISRGTYIQYRVQTKGVAGSSYFSEYRSSSSIKKNSLPLAPTWFSVSSTLVSYADTVTLSWAAAADPDGNLSRYRVEKTTNGGADWALFTTTSDTRTTYAIVDGAGTAIQFRVRSEDSYGMGSGYKSCSQIKVNSPPKAPPSFSASSALVNKGATVMLSWSVGSDPEGNLSGYQLEKGINGGTWAHLYTAEASAVSYQTVVNEVAGSDVQFRIRSVDTLGAYSGYSTCNAVRVNSPPGVSGSLLISKSKYNQGETVTLTWDAAEDTDANIAHYELESAVFSGTWSRWEALLNTTALLAVITPRGAPDGGAVRYRVRAVDALGLAGGYRESQIIQRDDYTGVRVCSGTTYQKAWVYVCKNGTEFTRGEVRVCKNGTSYEKATD